MATTECIYSGGGGGAEWITPTISGTTITCSWNYEADTVVLLIDFSGVSNSKHVFLYDVATKNYWWCKQSSGGVWTYGTADTRVSFTNKKSLTADYGSAPANVSVLPIVGKPNGYFS